MMPAAITAATASPAADVVEAGHDAARQLRLGHQLDGDLGGHRQHALAADHHGQQVQAGRVQRLGAELHRLALRREAAHAQHVVQRQAVLQAVHAAGVFGHVAADGAGDLAAGVGRVVQAVGAAASLMARLRTPHCTVAVRASGSSLTMRLNLASDSVTPSVRHGAAAQAGAGAARHHRHLQPWQAFSTAATWASVSGSATASGIWR
jgi:hypothetical protein